MEHATPRGDLRTGTALGLGAHLLWGLSPIYWNLVAGVAAIEILAHRVVWSVPLLLGIVALQRGFGALRAAFSSLRSLVLAVGGAVMLSINWGLFLWAVVTERIVEASLGYFMTPLVSVLLGVVVLGERLRSAQRAAVTIAGIGVAAMAVLHGSLPWVSLALAFSFGTYGLLKKTPGAVAALHGLFGEVVIVAIPLAIFIAGSLRDPGAVFAAELGATLWLLGAGVVTVAPLWLFGEGVQRIPLSTMGLLQYVAPSLQLLVGVSLYGESLSVGQAVGFVSVWVALLVFVRDQLRSDAPSTRSPDRAVTLPMSVEPDHD